MSGDVGQRRVVVPPAARRDARGARRRVEYADATSDAVGPGVNLLDLHVVKGLEFDAVVVVEPARSSTSAPTAAAAGCTPR